MATQWDPWDGNPIDLSLLSPLDLKVKRIVPKVLLDQGYSFTTADDCLVIKGKGIPDTRLAFGTFNLWFLLQWVEWSIGRAYRGAFVCSTLSGTVEKHAGTHALSLADTLGQPYLRSVMSSIAKKQGSVPVSLDFTEANELYKEYTYWDYADRYLGTSFRQFGKDEGLPRFAGLDGIKAHGPGSVPAGVSVWKLDFADMNVVERAETIRSLSSKFSYYYHPDKAEVFFTNEADANKNLPPTAAMLGLPKLSLRVPRFGVRRVRRPGGVNQGQTEEAEQGDANDKQQ